MKNSFYYFGKFLSLFKFFFKKNNDGVIISCTHSIKKNNFKNLEKLILKIKNEYEIISPDDFFNFLKGYKKIKKKSLLMTFDDGFKSNYNFANKVLSKYNIKAIFFIPTKILELKNDSEKFDFTFKNIYYNKISREELKHYETDYMNLDDIKDLSSKGHLISSHTYSHLQIKDIKNKNDVNLELFNPLKFLENKLKTKHKAIAFPVGGNKNVSKYSYNKIIHYYDYCFTMLAGVNFSLTDKHILNRFNLPDNATHSYLSLQLNGVYDFYYKLKRILLIFKIK